MIRRLPERMVLRKHNYSMHHAKGLEDDWNVERRKATEYPKTAK